MASRKSEPCGEVNRQPVELFTLRNGAGMSVELSSYGAAIVRLLVPDASGDSSNVVHSLEVGDAGSRENHPYCGVTVGRVSNRVRAGRFTLDGVLYELEQNNGPNHLHGGSEGLHRRAWTGTVAESGSDSNAVCFRYVSPDGEGNYPGTLLCFCTYTLTADNALVIDYRCTVEGLACPVSLTNHSFFNLELGRDGASHAPSVLAHKLHVRAGRVTELDDTQTTTGRFLDVAVHDGGALDFTAAAGVAVGERFSHRELKRFGGLDHSFVIDAPSRDTPIFHRPAAASPATVASSVPTAYHCATLSSAPSGRVLRVYTSQPGVQVYSGNFLDGTVKGAGGTTFPRHSGLCLETQNLPDAVNHSHFPSPVLRPGQQYAHTTVYQFEVSGAAGS